MRLPIVIFILIMGVTFIFSASLWIADAGIEATKLKSQSAESFKVTKFGDGFECITNKYKKGFWCIKVEVEK